ncbi:MAG: proprotein convertase P-domain-containing protein, partial [Sulfuritalea sp.]|nr:proprotein convertase P-domain-containing protein [Sulfuritalea sp.]
PNLGYRDVQQILALTARKVNDPNTDTTYNGATNWNGGGMHTSHDYGFGDVDARAAVRLAESWVSTRASYNERHLGSGEGSLSGVNGSAANLGIAINDGAVITRTLNIGAGLRAEHATVSLDITHSNWGDLTVELISPTGTISKLIANPGTSATNPGGDVGTGQLTFALDTTHDYGENAQGNWQLRITDRSGLGTGTLNGWKVDVYGSDLNETNPGLDTAGSTPLISATGNNQYFYTDEFATAPGASRATLTDSNGGGDILNATAVSTGSTINLNNGTTSTIAGRGLTINGDVEHAFGGDGNDMITGNALSNRLSGGRGNDTLSGGDSMDLLDGGQGNDTLTGGAGNDYFVIGKAANSVDTITDFSPGTVGEKILLVGFDNVTDYSQIVVTQEGANTRLNLGDGQSVLLQNIAPTGISEQNFGFFSDTTTLEKFAKYTSNPTIWSGDSGVQNTLLPGSYGDLLAFALGGDDVVGGRTTNDLIDGGDGNVLGSDSQTMQGARGYMDGCLPRAANDRFVRCAA